MYPLISLMLLLLWKDLDSKILQMPEITKIISNVRVLCPHNSFCGETPLSTTPISTGSVPCCKDCSCEPDCYLKNDCCFPPQREQVTKNECLYPVSLQKSGPLLFGKTAYQMVVDADNCHADLSVYSKTIMSRNFSHINGANTEIESEEVKGNCSRCKCSLDMDKNSYDCVCDKPILNESGKCTCGDVQVAPWGSMFPVSSRSTNLVYKNPLCATCLGITDGVIWTPMFVCHKFELHFIKKIIDGRYLQRCKVAFTIPEILDSSKLLRCLRNRHPKPCVQQDATVPEILNMTASEIVSACYSNFSSSFRDEFQNVFCFLCYGYSMSGTECADETGLKFVDSYTTLLLADDFFGEKSTTSDKKRSTQACSKEIHSDCRTILCPSGQVHGTDGACVYPILEAYCEGYLIYLRLFTETGVSIREIIKTLPEEKIKEHHLVSPMPKNWKNIFTLLETSRLTSSGNIINQTSFIVKIAILDPERNFKSMLIGVKDYLEKTWILAVKNFTVPLKSEFFDHIPVASLTDKYVQEPVGLNDHNDMNLPFPKWTLQFTVKYNIRLTRFKGFHSITRLMFCEQVLLDPSEYSFTAGENIVYFKSEQTFFYGAEFAYDRDGDKSVRVCLDETSFVKIASSSKTYLQKRFVNFVSCFFILAVLLS